MYVLKKFVAIFAGFPLKQHRINDIASVLCWVFFHPWPFQRRPLDISEGLKACLYVLCYLFLDENSCLWRTDPRWPTYRVNVCTQWIEWPAEKKYSFLFSSRPSDCLQDSAKRRTLWWWSFRCTFEFDDVTRVDMYIHLCIYFWFTFGVLFLTSVGPGWKRRGQSYWGRGATSESLFLRQGYPRHQHHWQGHPQTCRI